MGKYVRGTWISCKYVNKCFVANDIQFLLYCQKVELQDQCMSILLQWRRKKTLFLSIQIGSHNSIFFCMFHSFIDFWKNPPNNIWPFPLGLHLVLSLMKKYETQLFSDKVHASRWQGLVELKKRSFEPSFTKRASALLIKQRVHFVMQKWLKMQKCIDQTSVLLYYSDLFVKGVVSLLIFKLARQLICIKVQTPDLLFGSYSTLPSPQ